MLSISKGYLVKIASYSIFCCDKLHLKQRDEEGKDGKCEDMIMCFYLLRS